MSVNSISSGIASASGLVQAARSSGKKVASAVSNGINAVAAAGAAFRDIASQYQVTSMSPQALVEMLQKLRSAGAISEAEYQDLSAIRSDLDAEGVSSDKAINLLEFYANRLEKLQKEQTSTSDATAQTAIGAAQRRLNWLKKVAAVQSSAANMGVDRMA